MNMKNFKLSIYIILFLCGLTMSVNAVAADWKIYPAFDNNPMKIIDAPENTYFLVHQQKYQKNYNGYGFPSLTLFEFDKVNPADGIKPLVAKSALSGADVRLAEYSPAGGYLLVAYNSGAIDLVTRDGDVTTIDVLKRSNVPGDIFINSVTFDNVTGDAWVATDGGYLHIDAASKSVARKSAFDKPLSWIGQVGNILVAIFDGGLYECNSLKPRSSAEFKPISGTSSPLALLPLSATEFAYLSGAPRVNVSVMLARKSDNGWNLRNLGSDSFHALADNVTVTHCYEPNILPNRDGYLLYSASKAWQLKRGVNGGGAALFSVALPAISLPIGSWDMTDFWSYKERGEFQRNHASYPELTSQTSATWSEAGEALRPDAPDAFIGNIGYSPDFGMLLINHGQVEELKNDSPVTPMLLSGKRGDSWLRYSQVVNTPYSVETNEDLKSKYNANINRFPLNDPSGIAVDPLYPNWVSCGSMWGGVAFMDLSDPKKDVIRFGAPNDLFNNFPGFMPALPQQTWGQLSCVSTPDFDSDGRMWVLFCNRFGTDSKAATTQLWYLTPSDRARYYEGSEKGNKWQVVAVPMTQYSGWSSNIFCGKHARNKNRVFGFTADYPTVFFVADHHGNPENKEAIDFKVVTHLDNGKGFTQQIERQSSAAEDPVTGEIIITARNGVFVFDPDAEVVNGVGKGDRLSLRGGNPGDIVPAEGNYYKVLFDDEGRMWLGTRNLGVVGVNKERTEVIARYNTDNSPIPSDWVIGLGWNPETRSLVISTDHGLAEVCPDDTSASVAALPYLSMTSVAPGYNGTVEVRNITPGASVVIRDNTGEEVRRLALTSGTVAEWDLKNNNGAVVRTGHYTITVGNNPPLSIAVMR